MLGSVLYPVFLAAAWAPLAVERFLALVLAPSPRRAATLALVLAVQAATLGVEAVLADGALRARRSCRAGPGAGRSWRRREASCSPPRSRRRRSSAPRRCSRAPPGGGASPPRWA